MRELPEVPEQSFRDWWAARAAGGGRAPDRPPASTTHERARDPGAIAGARPGVAVPEVPRGYHTAGSGPPAGSADVVARFCERAAEYRAEVRMVPAGGLEAAVADVCAAQGARRLAVPPGAPQHLPGLELVVDDPPISARGLDQLDGVLTGCALAIAETGTVVLDGGERSGRRALTLVPDFHVCLVEAATVHASVPDAIAALEPAAAEGRPLTLRVGPERDVRHRARARRGRARPAHARHPGPGMIARLLAATVAALLVTAAPAVAGEPDATAPAYDVTLTGSDKGFRWTGRETITLTNPGATPLDRVWVRLWGNGGWGCGGVRHVRIGNVAGATAGAPATFCSAVPLQLAAPLAPGARGSVAFDVDIRVPATPGRFGHRQAVRAAVERDPGARPPRGRGVAAGPLLPARRVLDVPDRRLAREARPAAGDRGRGARRPAARREPPDRAGPRLLVRRRAAALARRDDRRGGRDRVGPARPALRRPGPRPADRPQAPAPARRAVRPLRLAGPADLRHRGRLDGAHGLHHDRAPGLRGHARARARVVVRADRRRPGAGAVARRGVRLLRRGGGGRAALRVVQAARPRAPASSRAAPPTSARTTTTATASSTPRAPACSTSCASAWARARFGAALRAYADANRYGWSTGAEFRAAMDAASPVALGDLWRRYRVG